VIRPAIALALLSAILLAFVPEAALSSPRRRPQVRELAPGVTLTKRIDRRKPLRTYVLAVDPTKGASIGLVLSNDLIPGLERTSEMAERAGALAAVNGDFPFESGRPVRPFAMGGELVQTTRAPGPSFTIGADGTMDIITPAISMTAVEVQTGIQWPISSWNGNTPYPAQLNAYTEIGGVLAPPKPNACWATLLPTVTPAPSDTGMTQEFAVTLTGCAAPPAPVGDEVVLATKPLTDDAAFLASLAVGETVTITWSLGRAGVTDAMGGSHLLVDGGAIVVGGCTGAVCDRNPRTAVGLTQDGRLLLVIVDGRYRISRGMTMDELARFMLRQGAVEAMNLDGGGSSTLVAEGRVVNRPSDGFEREVSSAIVVRLGPAPESTGG
jgi:exopolysaccharide biosynthesis protein